MPPAPSAGHPRRGRIGMRKAMVGGSAQPPMLPLLLLPLLLLLALLGQHVRGTDGAMPGDAVAVVVGDDDDGVPRRASSWVAWVSGPASPGPIAELFLPAFRPNEYARGDPLEVRVGQLWSAAAHVPVDYYAVPACPAAGPGRRVQPAPNIGAVLAGDVTQRGPYVLEALADVPCALACVLDLGADPDGAARLTHLVRQGYRVLLEVDGLPATEVREIVHQGARERVYERGYLLGTSTSTSTKEKEKDGDGAGGNGDGVALHNHIGLEVHYHEVEGRVRIVGVNVVAAMSRGHEASAQVYRGGMAAGSALDPSACEDSVVGPQAASGKVAHTYSVRWVSSRVTWATRWDALLETGAADDDLHCFALINSLLIALFLSGMIAIILLRTLKAELSRYDALIPAPFRDMEAGDALLRGGGGAKAGVGVGDGVGGGGSGAAAGVDAREEGGWKAISKDVFRPPRHADLLSVLVGTGLQVTCMAAGLLACSLLGFYSPENRGGLVSNLVIFFCVLGFPGGYAAARHSKNLNAPESRRGRVALGTALGFPGVALAVFTALNAVIGRSGTGGAVPLFTLATLGAWWLLLCAPLVYAGCLLGFRGDPVGFPIKPSLLVRPIPRQTPWYCTLPAQMAIGGLATFCGCFIELFYVLTRLWLNQFVSIFGVCAVVAAILALSAAEVGVIATYFTLSAEQHDAWWWRSWLVPATSGALLLVYGLVFFSRAAATPEAATAIAVYLALAASCCSLYTGYCGHAASLLFVRVIYASVKVD